MAEKFDFEADLKARLSHHTRPSAVDYSRLMMLNERIMAPA